MCFVWFPVHMFKTRMLLVAGLVQPISEKHSSMQINSFQDPFPVPDLSVEPPVELGLSTCSDRRCMGAVGSLTVRKVYRRPLLAAHFRLWLIAVYTTFLSNRGLWNRLLFWKLTTKCTVSFDVIERRANHYSAIVASLLLLSAVVCLAHIAVEEWALEC